MASVLIENSTAATTSIILPHLDWTCPICEKAMQMGSQRTHLLGRKHIAMVEKYGVQEKHLELLQSPQQVLLQMGKYTVKDLPEVDLKQPLPPVGVSLDLDISYLRMKKEMEHYGNPQEASQNQDTTTVPGGQGLETDLPEVDLPITDPRNSPRRKSMLKRYGQVLDPWVEPEEPGNPSAVLVALKAAQYIKDFSTLNYPVNIQPPGMAFNPTRTLLYEREFLLQFQTVFTEKPTVSWDKKILWAFGDPATARAQTSRTPSGVGPGTKARRPSVDFVGVLGSFNPSTPIVNPFTNVKNYAQSSGNVKPNPPPISAFSPPAKVSPTGQSSQFRFDQWRSNRVTTNPFSAAANRPSTVLPEAADLQTTPGDPFGSLEKTQSPRTGSRSSRGAARRGSNGSGKIDPPTTVTGNDSVGGLTKNDGNERTPPRELYPVPDEPPYNVLVGNLAPDTTEEKISEFFSQCDFMKVKLIHDKDDDHFRGFGYAQFNTKEGLVAAVGLNGTRVSGRNIRINIAKPPTKPSTRIIDSPTNPLNPTEAIPTPPSTVVKPRTTRPKTWSDLLNSTKESRAAKVPLQTHTNRVILTPSVHEGVVPLRTSKEKWYCAICSCTTGLDQKEMHLAGVKHAENLRSHNTTGGSDQRKLAGSRPPGGTNH